MKQKLEGLLTALEDAMTLRVGIDEMNDSITRISSLKEAAHNARKALSQIDKQAKISEGQMYSEILADASLKNADARKIALENDKANNAAYQDLMSQRQEALDIIAQKESAVETETNRFKALCISAEQKTAVINALSSI